MLEGDSFENEELLESLSSELSVEVEEKVMLLSRLGLGWPLTSEWRSRSDRGRGRW